MCPAGGDSDMNFIKTAMGRPVTVSMFVVAVILFGLVSLDRLAVNLLPDISYPSLTVQTDYPDAAPAKKKENEDHSPPILVSVG